uniref:Uncharacterized protein n=1 Tax=Anguilla anguilla TaxID=7936 RepID=A0A0E9QL76_ANGAN
MSIYCTVQCKSYWLTGRKYILMRQWTF